MLYTGLGSIPLISTKTGWEWERERPLSLNPQLREWAPKDEDFKSVWDDENFKKLTLQGLL